MNKIPITINLCDTKKEEDVIVLKNKIFIETNNLENIKKIIDNIGEYCTEYDEFGNIEKTEINLKELVLSSDLIVNEIDIDKISENSIEVLNYYSSTIKKVSFKLMKLNEIISILNQVNLSENTKFMTKYNEKEWCTLDDLVGATEYINNIRDYVMQFNFSNLEICIFVYDLLREREYKFSKYDLDRKNGTSDNIIPSDEEFEKLSSSRSLMKVYKGNEIVCAGFAKIYMAVLESLGIKSEEITFIDINDPSGHATNLVFLNDKKYNEKCIIEIDPTWGRLKTNSNKYSYKKTLYNYSSFGKSIMRTINEKKHLNMKLGIFSSSIIESIFTCTERIKKLCELEAPQCMLLSDLNILYKRISLMKNQYDFDIFDEEIEKTKNLIDCLSYDECLSLIDSISNKLKYTFSSKNFFMALLNVKKVENYINPNKYKFDVNKVIDAFSTRFEKDQIKEFLLIKCIFSNLDKLADYNFDDLDDLRLEINPINCIQKKKVK